METYATREAVLKDEARAILDKAIAERRVDLNHAEERAFQGLLAEIRRLGDTPSMTPPTAGDGWKTVSTPDDHALQRVSEQIWHCGFRSPWPGFRVCFGELQPGDAARTFFHRKLIVIDLDNYRRYGDTDLEKSLHHELAHVAWRDDADHGDPRFHQTINELWERVPRLIPAWRDSR